MTCLLASACHSLPQPASSLSVADRSAERQLLSGFYFLEQNKWRWTAREFAAALKPPADAGRKGGRLVLHFFLPPAITQEFGPITLSAKLDNIFLTSQTYSQSGDHFYTRPIPAHLLDTSLIRVDFCLDKYLPPRGPGGRELGTVVTNLALISN